MNINVMNQSSKYPEGKPNINTIFSTLQMAQTTTSTGNVDNLIPIAWREMQPNQTVSTKIAINMQFTPFVSALMHQMKGELITYFVPYRLIWDDLEDFITGGEDGTKTLAMPGFSPRRVIMAAIERGRTKISEELGKLDVKQLKDDVFTWNENKNLVDSFNKWVGALNDSWFVVEANNDFIFGDGVNAEYYMELLRKRQTKALAVILDVIIKHSMLGSIWDYLGLPIQPDFVLGMMWISTYFRSPDFSRIIINGKGGIKESWEKVEQIWTTNEVSSLPFRAYSKIYNDWIKLYDWEKDVEIYKGSERDDPKDINAALDLHKGNYDWDYFTRARRYQLRGAMPTIPVRGELLVKALDTAMTPNKLFTQMDDMMTASALMNYFTANAKIRPRYAEHLLARWNVGIQDARLQMAEFVGGGEIGISSQGVVQTSAGGEGQTQQGNITGQIWGNASGVDVHYKAQEHGIMLTLLLIKPANVYETGFNPILRRKTRFEMPTPEMVNLPDTPIYKREIMPAADPKALIGYKAIYDEYRTTVNNVTGLVRPSLWAGLRSYTLARNMVEASVPEIVKCHTDMNRIKQYITEPDFVFIVATSTSTAIPLPFTSDITKAL